MSKAYFGLRKPAVTKINALEQKILALRKKQDDIREAERKHEEAEKKRRWLEDNAECIAFCKGLVGKAFIFGDSVIKHHLDTENGVTTREYDYVSVYFAKTISYRDRTRVCMSARHMFCGDTYGTLGDNTDVFLKLERLEDGWMATCCGNPAGNVHVLTAGELQEASDFWTRRMSELASRVFTDPSENRWVCPAADGADRDLPGTK